MRASIIRSRGSRGSMVFETVVVCLVVGVLVTVALERYRRVENAAKRAALAMELTNIRTAVRLYFILNRRYPSDLRALTAEKYLFPDEQQAGFEMEGGRVEPGGVFKRSYLEGAAVDASGFILDPYGRRYRYDSRTGEVAPAG